MPTISDATLVTGQRWTNNAPQITFDAGYSCWRENNGMATYNTWVKINKLLTSQSFFNPPINVEAKIKIGSDAAQYFSWSGSTSKTFKDYGVATWSNPITYTTDNKSVSVAPGTAVTITIRLYSNNDQGSNRDATYTYTGIAVPAYTNASLTSVGNVTINNCTGNTTVSGFTAQNVVSSNTYTYTLTASINGNAVGTATLSGGVPTTLSISNNDALIRITHSSSATIQYALTTKNNGQQIGNVSYMSGTCTVDTNTVEPRVTNVQYTRLQNGSTWTNSKSIQGITTLRITSFQYDAAAGSQRAYYEAIVGSETRRFTEISSESPVDIVLNEAGNISFKIAAVDQRGARGESTTITLKVLPYSPPQITSYSSTRCNIAGGDDIEGTYFKANISTQISPIRKLSIVRQSEGQTSTHEAYIQYNGVEYHGGPIPEEYYFSVQPGDKLTLYVKNSDGQAGINIDGNTTYYNDGARHSIEIDFDYDYNASVDANIGMIKVDKSPVTASSPALDVLYKTSTGVTWYDGGTYQIVGSPITPTPIIGDGNISPDSSYDIKYSVSDRFTKSAPITVQDYLSSAQYTLFLAKGGKAISVGEVYTPVNSTDKVLNINEDWSVTRSGSPVVEKYGAWVIHYIGGGYVEMWSEINISQMRGWTRQQGSDIYYSSYKFFQSYPTSKLTFAAAPERAPFVTATLRTYWTDSTNHPSIWLVSDATADSYTYDKQYERTPMYSLGSVGSLSDPIDAKITIHVFGKLASS